MLPATQQIVSDPMEKVAVIGAYRTCQGMLPASYVNLVRSAAAAEALQAAGLSPTTYLPPSISNCGTTRDNVAVVEKGYASRVNPTTIFDPFEQGSNSGTALVSSSTTGYEVSGGPTSRGMVTLGETSSASILGTPSPVYASFKNQPVTGSLPAATPAELSAVSANPTVGGSAQMLRANQNCRTCAAGSSFF